MINIHPLDDWMCCDAFGCIAQAIERPLRKCNWQLRFGPYHYNSFSTRSAYLRLLRKRSMWEITRSMQTTFTIFRQQFAMDWEMTYVWFSISNGYGISRSSLFEDREENISSNHINLLLENLAHQGDNTACFNNELASVIVCLCMRKPNSRNTAAHRPILIFISISAPLILWPSVFRMDYGVIREIRHSTPSFCIDASFSFQAVDGREIAYPILFRVCSKDIYIISCRHYE